MLSLCIGLCACGDDEVGAFRILEELGGKDYATMYRLDDKVGPVVEAAMSTLAANGTLSRICATWIGSNEILYTGDSGALAAVEDMPPSRTLMVGVDTDAPPFAYTSGGQLVGMSVDIANAIGSVLGWNVKILSVKSAEIGTQLSSGNIDCAIGFDPDCVDPAKYNVGQVYMESSIVLAAPTQGDIKRTGQLDGQRIGTISDPALEAAIAANDKIAKHSSGATVYLTPPRCISAMENGWCAAIVMDSLMLKAYAQTYTPPAPELTFMPMDSITLN